MRANAHSAHRVPSRGLVLAGEQHHGWVTASSTLVASDIAPGAMLAGYRVVRLLGRGSRSTVWLGHAGPNDAPRVVAIKVFGEGVPRVSIDAELRALSAAAHPHVVQLLDLSSSVTPAPCLVMERLTTSSLATVVAEREVIPAGEAVTMVAPVVSAIVALHESGIAHGSISATNILFRETGAPVLIGFGAPDAALEHDREGLVALVRVVLARVRTNESTALVSWLTELQRPLHSTLAAQLSERVFELGVAQPIQFAVHSRSVSASPSRVITAQPSERAESPTALVTGGGFGHTTVTARADSSGHASLPAAAELALRSLLERLPSGIRHHVLRIGARVAALRKPVWLAIGIAVVVVVAGVATAPQNDANDALVAHATDSDDPAQGAASDAQAGGPADEPVANGPVHDDDPAAAFVALWTLRRECIMQLSVLCLDAVDQNGSAALDEDAALIAAIENGSADGSSLAIAPTAIMLVERHGDAALISFETSPSPQRTTASALLVKGEAGWRVRDYIGG
jgi:eukaryotic-like serine/threonine-protein kinase